MKKQFIRAVSSSVMGLSLVTGLAGAQTGSISSTGASSFNRIRANTTVQQTVDNNNNVGAHSTNSQSADSGKAKSFQNTTGGDARSGAARNTQSTSLSASISNGNGSGGNLSSWAPSPVTAAIRQTGFNSVNNISANTSLSSQVTNNNNLDVSNTNSQTANSGSASSFQNTTGGSAVSGDAVNSSSSTIRLSVSN